MTNHVKNLKGKIFGRLKVISFESVRGGHAYWNCGCICGNKIVARGNHITSGVTVSCGCYNQDRASKWLRKYATSSAHRGEGNPMWKGGISLQNELDRKIVRYKICRTKCFKRDKYTCQNCDIQGGKLHAHHIKPFSKYPHLRFRVSNLITLCEKCHKDTVSYGVNKLTL